jgi:hypothetical protein
MNKTLTIPTSAVDALRKAYGRITRAAARMGVTMDGDGMNVLWPTKRELLRTKQVILNTEDGEMPQVPTKYLVEVVDVTLDIPDIGAESGKWQVAGIVNLVHHEEGTAFSNENEIFSEHEDVRQAYRSARLFCDHCRTNRYRVRTIICREVATNRLLQVGVECGQHYVRDAEKDTKALEFRSLVCSIVDVEFADDEEGGGCWGGSSVLTAFDAEDVVAMTLKVVRDCNGYQPSKIKGRDIYDDPQPNPSATWRTVCGRLCDPEPKQDAKSREIASTWLDAEPTMTPAQREVLDRVKARLADELELRRLWQSKQPTDADRSQAKVVLEWLASAVGDAEFLTNLKATFAPGWVSNKRLGFACCVTVAYDRAKAEAEKLANPPTEPAPEGRVSVEGVIKTLREVENDFGRTWKMLVELTNRTRVWCSVPTGANAEVGSTIKFTATFTRSDKDQFFAFGKIPKLWTGDKPAKVRKAKPPAEPQPVFAGGPF